MKERLDKILAYANFGSRKEVKGLIKKGVVSVNGIIITDPGYHIDTERDTIKVGEELINYSRYVYIMLNKPKGFLSATVDEKYPTVLDLLPEYIRKKQVFPVGRLDKDTEGLLLITNDGLLAHNLLSPKKKVEKLYYVLLEGRVDYEDIDKFRRGIELEDGYITLPAKLEIMESGDTSEVLVTIIEGKYHQIKRMFAALNKTVIYLKRLKFGPLELDPSLKEGDFRFLTGDEVNILKTWG